MLHSAIILPVEYKLRNTSRGKVGIDIGQLQNVVHLFRRLPVGFHGTGFFVGTKGCDIFSPLISDVLDKLCAPGS